MTMKWKNAIKGSEWGLYVLVMRIELVGLLNGGKFQQQPSKINWKTQKMMGVKWMLI